MAELRMCSRREGDAWIERGWVTVNGVVAEMGMLVKPTDVIEVSEHDVIDEHPHEHGKDCGHIAVPHGDHVDYVHDGHRHAIHEKHYDEH